MSRKVPSWLRRFDDAAVATVGRYGVLALRVALGIIYLWFGALKLAGVSPVADLVARMLPFLPHDVAVRSMGALEVLIGLGLLTGWAIRVTLLLFFLQMLGTFLVLIFEPLQSFQGGNPLVLTTQGEFVIKNLVLIAAGIVIAGAITPARPREPLSRMLGEKLD